jgi:hypothetical protein
MRVVRCTQRDDMCRRAMLAASLTTTVNIGRELRTSGGSKLHTMILRQWLAWLARTPGWFSGFDFRL